MSEIYTSEIFNHVDKKYFTLHIEWFDSYFKVILLQSQVIPLSGEMSLKDIDFFCEQLSKSPIEYFLETKKMLCGKDDEIQFFIKNKIFEWKKNVWTFGRINLYDVSSVEVISETFQKSLRFYRSIQDKVSILENENKILLELKEKLSSEIKQMIEIKAVMEQDLYKKFILILNSKKEKIRELNNIIKEKEKTKDTIFDAQTDGSEESNEENDKINDRYMKHNLSRKRKSTDNNRSKNTQNTKKTNTIINTDYRVDAETSYKKSINVASSSHEPQSCGSRSRRSRSSLNFIEDESEEELFSN